MYLGGVGRCGGYRLRGKKLYAVEAGKTSRNVKERTKNMIEAHIFRRGA